MDGGKDKRHKCNIAITAIGWGTNGFGPHLEVASWSNVDLFDGQLFHLFSSHILSLAFPCTKCESSSKRLFCLIYVPPIFLPPVLYSILFEHSVWPRPVLSDPLITRSATAVSLCPSSSSSSSSNLLRSYCIGHNSNKRLHWLYCKVNQGALIIAK